MRQRWDPHYKIWVEHDEPASPMPPPVIDNIRQPLMSNMTVLLNDLSYIPLNNEHNEPNQGDIGETSNEPTQATRNKFEELYASANEELYLGCDYVTRLDFMANFTYFKAKGRLIDSIFNEMLEFFQNVFPIIKGFKVSPSYYAIKKTFKMIELGWKDSNTPGKKVPKKMLCYFPIISRIQCLYKSSHTANDMIWYATGKCTKLGQKFNMRAMVLWTINDFPTRSSLSRWSGQDNTDPAKEFGQDVILAQLDRLPTRVKGKHPSHGGVKIKRNVHVELNSTKRPEIDTYRSQFKSLFHKKDMQEEFPDWFGSQIHQRHIDNDQDPEVSTTSKLFALANGPSWTLVLVNSCVIEGVRYVMHSHDERRTTQNNGISSPGPDREMYYGQL
ncbi:hypothetical protein Tco_0526403 [Tanacetum coccineum]